MKLSIEEMQFKLQQRFPKLEVLDNSEFSADQAKGSGLWLKNASEISYTVNDNNTLLAGENEPNSRLYELDVYKKFDAFCQKRGWYASTESYTLQLFKL